MSRRHSWENCFLTTFFFKFSRILSVKKWDFWPKTFGRFVQNCISCVQKKFLRKLFSFHDWFCFFSIFLQTLNLKFSKNWRKTGLSKIHFTCPEEVFEEAVFFWRYKFPIFFGFLPKLLTVFNVPRKTFKGFFSVKNFFSKLFLEFDQKFYCFASKSLGLGFENVIVGVHRIFFRKIDFLRKSAMCFSEFEFFWWLGDKLSTGLLLLQIKRP